MYDACKVARSDKEKSTDELFDAYMCKFYFKGAWEHAITRDAQFKVKMESMNIKTFSIIDRKLFIVISIFIQNIGIF